MIDDFKRPPILDQLRGATEERHLRLEASLNLTRAGLSVTGYTDLLKAFYGFYEPWEEVSAPLLDAQLRGIYGYKRKVPYLLEDLAWLGLGDAETEALPRRLRCEEAVFPQILGQLYVVEGATLGGRLLASRFSQAFHFEPGRGCSFFASYGKDLSTRWREFAHTLGQVAEFYDAADIQEGAVQMFDDLHVWFSSVGVIHD